MIVFSRNTYSLPIISYVYEIHGFSKPTVLLNSPTPLICQHCFSITFSSVPLYKFHYYTSITTLALSVETKTTNIMVGQLTATKPSRSDEVLDFNEQIRNTNQIKAQFDALTPKRPIKPNRSEPETENTVNSSTLSSHNIPELEKLQSLQSNSQVFPSSHGAVDGQDEFVETQYYKELLSIDKQHHAVRDFTMFLCFFFSFLVLFVIVFGNTDGKRVYKSG